MRTLRRKSRSVDECMRERRERNIQKDHYLAPLVSPHLLSALSTLFCALESEAHIPYDPVSFYTYHSLDCLLQEITVYELKEFGFFFLFFYP